MGYNGQAEILSTDDQRTRWHQGRTENLKSISTSLLQQEHIASINSCCDLTVSHSDEDEIHKYRTKSNFALKLRSPKWQMTLESLCEVEKIFKDAMQGKENEPLFPKLLAVIADVREPLLFLYAGST